MYTKASSRRATVNCSNLRNHDERGLLPAVQKLMKQIKYIGLTMVIDKMGYVCQRPYRTLFSILIFTVHLIPLQ